MAVAGKGTLVACDPSIRALILQIDSDRHDIVIEELDDKHLLIETTKVQYVKDRLNEMLSKNIYDPFNDEADH